MRKLLWITLGCIAISYICFSLVSRQTPQETIEAYYSSDSIRIVRGESDYAKNYIIGILKEKKVEYECCTSTYDEDEEAYEVIYHLTKGDKSVREEKAWVRMHFQSNHGKYIVAPQIIKTSSEELK